MSWRLPRPRVPLPPQSGHAARVALAATLLVGVVYAGCVTILDQAVTARLVASVDTRLREHLAGALASERGPAPAGPPAARPAARQVAARQRPPVARTPTMMTTSMRRPCSCGEPGPARPRSR